MYMYMYINNVTGGHKIKQGTNKKTTKSRSTITQADTR